MIATARDAYKARTALDLGADVAIDASTADFGELAKAEGASDSGQGRNAPPQPCRWFLRGYQASVSIHWTPVLALQRLLVSPGFILYVLDLFLHLMFSTASHPTEGVLMRRMRTGRDAAPAGPASSAGPPGASGVTARPNYVGPSGNGLVERMNAGAKNPAG